MPDPIVKIMETTESGRTIAFDFKLQPEIVGGENLVSVTKEPSISPTGPTFGPTVISGSQIQCKLNGTITAGVTYTLSVTVSSSRGSVMTCAGTLYAE